MLHKLTKAVVAAALATAALCGVAQGAYRRIKADTTPLRQFELEPPFIDAGMQMRNWDFGGDTIVNTNSYIRLTPDLTSRKGYIWSRQTLPNDGWELEFSFNVGTKGGYLYGDGMAMWATTERATPGPIYGNKDFFKGFGLVFDTYANSPHDFTFPIVQGVISDGSTPYDYAHDGDANRAGKCNFFYRNQDHPTVMRVTYIKENFLHVQYKLFNKDWADCFTISNVTLPKGLYLGFTALTGQVTDDHDLYTVFASEKHLGKSSDFNHYFPGMSTPTIMNSPTPSNFVGTFFKLLLGAIFLGVLYVAYRMFSSNGGANRF
ncbi:hypothetical protein EV182_001411 [Spiromyces aspiralis]|uniref:Uncharacterized protein n=1 Tax=Spiromyces aspiralis TaxID=68401 RepID=A0ACC1HTW0_9FUNG|nr:hypothetical protein EV182_001411 [Spiromyces aspiralis]